MAKVGSIKQYHSGAAYDVANIYDAKQTSMPGATKVLMHFDSSATTDECGNTWTAVTSKKCLYLNGSSYTQTSNVDAFNFGTGDFTIDWWEWRNAVTYKNPTFTIARSPSEAASVTGVLGYGYNDGGLKFWLNSDSISGSMGTQLAQQWVHRAFVRKGNTYYVFQNGILITQLTGNALVYNSSAFAYIGVQYGGYFTGYIDELRVSVGIARWTANFTPPTSAYSVDGAITVNGNMMIRHNGANCYIPLTTTKANTSVPCLTVRHNNANYYAIK